jgi:hypothetical protein
MKASETNVKINKESNIMQLSQGSRDGVVFAATTAWVVNIASTKRLPSISYSSIRHSGVLSSHETKQSSIKSGQANGPVKFLFDDK